MIGALICQAPQASFQAKLCLRRALFAQMRARAYSISQRPDAGSVRFPGAVDSRFTSTLHFEQPATYAAIPTYRAMSPEGDIIDASITPPTDELCLKMYTNMLAISIMDLIMFDAQRQGRLSFYMTSQGEEGTCVGSASALEKDDVVFSQYREAGVFMQRGFTFDDFMNQLFANRKDCGKGRNMPVHYGSAALKIHTISSPLATQIPHASGAAYALKLQRLTNPNLSPRIVACYFGEGAASEGDFHAALNIAATRSCPVVFICRNNGYAISTPTLEQYRGDGIASRGTGYGIDTVRVDGNDIFAVREVTQRAREIALQGDSRPVLIEAMSYRISHHSTSDDSFAYRARIEVEDWKRRDNPITRLRKYLERRGVWDDNKEREERHRIRRDVLAAFARAEREPKPALGTMFEDVYEHLTPDLAAQKTQLKDVLERYGAEYDLSGYEDGLAGLR